MSEALHAAILEVPESGWKAYGKPEPMWIGNAPRWYSFSNEGTGTERGETAALRGPSGCGSGREDYLLDGARVALCRAQQHLDWEPVKLIEWHREKPARSSGYMMC